MAPAVDLHLLLLWSSLEGIYLRPPFVQPGSSYHKEHDELPTGGCTLGNLVHNKCQIKIPFTAEELKKALFFERNSAFWNSVLSYLTRGEVSETLFVHRGQHIWHTPYTQLGFFFR